MTTAPEVHTRGTDAPRFTWLHASVRPFQRLRGTLSLWLGAVVISMPQWLKWLVAGWGGLTAYLIVYYLQQAFNLAADGGALSVLFPTWLADLFRRFPPLVLGFGIAGFLCGIFGIYIRWYDRVNGASMLARSTYLNKLVRDPSALRMTGGTGPLGLAVYTQRLELQPRLRSARSAVWQRRWLPSRVAEELAHRHFLGVLSELNKSFPYFGENSEQIDQALKDLLDTEDVNEILNDIVGKRTIRRWQRRLRWLVEPPAPLAWIRGPALDRWIVQHYLMRPLSTKREAATATVAPDSFSALNYRERRWFLRGRPSRRVVMLGGAAAETRSLLPSLAQRQARRALHRPGALIPIYLSLPDMRAALKTGTLLDYIAQREQTLGIGDATTQPGFLLTWMQRGQVLFCIDAVYESSSLGTPTALEALRALAQLCGVTSNARQVAAQLPGRVVFIARREAIDVVPPPDLAGHVWAAVKLADDELKEHIAGIFDSLSHARATSDEDEHGGRPAPDATGTLDLANTFVTLLAQDPARRTWSEGWATRQLAAYVYFWHRELPADLVALHHAYVDTVLQRTHPDDPMRRHAVRHISSRLAWYFELHEREEISGEELIATLIDQIQVPPGDASVLANDLLRAELLVERQPGFYAFPDPTVRAFLAATHVALDTLRGGTLAWERRADPTYEVLLAFSLSYLTQFMGADGAKASAQWHERLRDEAQMVPEPDRLVAALRLLQHVPTPGLAWGAGFTEWETTAVKQWMDEIEQAGIFNYGRLQRLLGIGREFAYLEDTALDDTRDRAVKWLGGTNLHRQLLGAIVLGALADYRHPKTIERLTLCLNDSAISWPALCILMIEGGLLGQEAPVEQLLRLAESQSHLAVRIAAYIALSLPEVKAPTDLPKQYIDALPRVLAVFANVLRTRLSQPKTAVRLRTELESGRWIGPSSPAMMLLSLLEDDADGVEAALRSEPDHRLRLLLLTAIVFYVALRPTLAHDQYVHVLGDLLTDDVHAYIRSLTAAMATVLGLPLERRSVGSPKAQEQGALVHLFAALLDIDESDTLASERNPIVALVRVTQEAWNHAATSVMTTHAQLRGTYLTQGARTTLLIAETFGTFLDLVDAADFNPFQLQRYMALIGTLAQHARIPGWGPASSERSRAARLRRNVSYLRRSMGDRDPLVRAQALTILGALAALQVAARDVTLHVPSAAFEHAMRDRQPQVRAFATALLSGLLVTEMSADDNQRETHSDLAKSLRIPRVPWQALSRTLRDNAAIVRAVAVSGACALVLIAREVRGDKKTAPPREDALVRTIASLSKQDSTPWVKVPAALATVMLSYDAAPSSEFPPVSEELNEIVRSGTPGQSFCVLALASLFAGDLVSQEMCGAMLAAALEHPNVLVNLTSIGLLSRWVSEEPDALLTAAASDSPQDNPWVSFAALVVLLVAQVAPSETLIACAYTGLPVKRALAIWGLSQLPDLPVDTLRGGLTSETPVLIRRATVLGLFYRLLASGSDEVASGVPATLNSADSDIAAAQDETVQESTTAVRASVSAPEAGQDYQYQSMTPAQLEQAAQQLHDRLNQMTQTESTVPEASQETQLNPARAETSSGLPVVARRLEGLAREWFRAVETSEAARSLPEPSATPQPPPDTAEGQLLLSSPDTDSVSSEPPYADAANSSQPPSDVDGLFMAALDDTDVWVRLIAVAGLATSSSADQEAFHSKAWNDQKSLLRLVALVLAPPSGPEWQQILAKALDADEDPLLRTIAVLSNGMLGKLEDHEFERLTRDQFWSVRAAALAVGGGRLLDETLIRLFEEGEDICSRVIAAMEVIARMERYPALSNDAGPTDLRVRLQRLVDSDPVALDRLVYATFGADQAARLGALPFLATLSLIESVLTMPARDQASWRVRVAGVELYTAWLPGPQTRPFPAGLEEDPSLEVREEVHAMQALLASHDLNNARDLTVMYLQSFTQRHLLQWFAYWLVTYGSIITWWDELVTRLAQSIGRSREDLFKVSDQVREWVPEPIMQVIEQALNTHLSGRDLWLHLRQQLRPDERQDVLLATLVALAAVPHHLESSDIDAVYDLWRSNTAEPRVREAAKDLLLAYAHEPDEAHVRPM